MTEAVRLVIWDLDDTFWKGTISEGSIEYQQNVHECVIELASRGIVSSICSKNDLQVAQTVLAAHGIWDYFVFPSINWEPKGQRIKSIIDLIQLRPPTVILIDDNPMNLNEARHYVPDIQVADETIIPTLLENPLFRGKDDRSHTRLKQYKLLERRKADELAAGGDNREFLLTSGIRVEIIYDVERHLDRAIEMINRTNQLNFTKRRLPEDMEEARAALLRQINAYDVQAGLVHVADNYGDYGVCGYFAAQTGPLGVRLLDFCFSCRILNMGVEKWVYAELGRPRLQVIGPVLSDLFHETGPIDWIARGLDRHKSISGQKSIDRVILHGGCDLMPMAVYFQAHAREVFTEVNALRDGVEIRIDHSSVLDLAMQGPSESQVNELAKLGYKSADFRTALTDKSVASPLVILSFGMDALLSTYRHKELKFRVPLLLPLAAGGRPSDDITKLDCNKLMNALPGHWALEAVEELRAHYIYEGVGSKEAFKERLSRILAGLPSKARVYIIGQNERPRYGGLENTLRHAVDLNSWVIETIIDMRNVAFIDIRDFVYDETEISETHPGHYGRMVYFRVFQHILSQATASSHAVLTEHKSATETPVALRGLRVSIEHEVSSHFDIVTELVNRTTDLNYTKRRLPEDRIAARRALAAMSDNFRLQVGLVRVFSDSEDYGFCGFYTYDTLANLLLDYCFSSRVMNLGVERFLYRRLGQPIIHIAGDVAVPLVGDADVDWITFAGDYDSAVLTSRKKRRSVFMRGGCDLQAIGHYVRLCADDIHEEYTVARAGLPLRRDHSQILRYSLEGISSSQLNALRCIGYMPEDLTTAVSDKTYDAYILDFWTDSFFPLYRDRETGVTAPFIVPMFNENIVAAEWEALRSKLHGPEQVALVQTLRERYDHIGLIDETSFTANLSALLNAVPGSGRLFILLALETLSRPGQGDVLFRSSVDRNNWTRNVAAKYSRVQLLNIGDFVVNQGEAHGRAHFDRAVYHRIGKAINSSIQSL